ncbi:MAG TPA: dTDP-4-dehydrorhamnose reductase [Gemmatimonadaceae bacterium]|nr:dTDP-4-dehydrorhamnose reductase [Gemmatimonadaceae bacterium]
MTNDRGPVAVLGGNGMLGRAVTELAGERSIEIASFSHSDLDVTEAGQVRSALGRLRPPVVLNLAGYTAVDRAEQEPGQALRVNRDGAANVAVAARAVGARVFYISTDYVFDGAERNPYPPDATARPLSVYGRTKWAGEEAVRAQHDDYVIVRTSWVFAPWGTNFVRTIVKHALAGRTLRVVNDQVGVPTAAQDLAAALFALLETPAFSGTVHFSCAGPVTWYGFARAILEELRANGSTSLPEIVPVTAAEYGAAAERPAYSVLDTTLFTAVTGVQPRSWRAALTETMNVLE